jgi:hypothetical protein
MGGRVFSAFDEKESAPNYKSAAENAKPHGDWDLNLPVESPFDPKYIASGTAHCYGLRAGIIPA